MGNKFHARLEDSIISTADIADPKAVLADLQRMQSQFVLNCAGKTGKPNVDWCEDHKLETMSSNVAGPLVLARECLEAGVHLTHLGSGCIYKGDNGGRGYSEEDAPNFYGSFYSRTKIWSEQVLREFPVLQLRLRMPLDGKPSPRNLITKLASYSKVISVTNSITVIDDLVKAAKELMRKKRTGVYNVTNPGTIEHR